MQTLAKLGQNPQQPEKDSLGRKAIKLLRGTIATLADTAKLTTACQTLLPAIASLLRLAP